MVTTAATRQANDIEALARGMVRYIRDPVAFVREVLCAEPDEWQVKALTAIAQRPRIAIRAGHGVGKTAMESWVILWFLFTRPFPKVPCTAPTRQQLLDVLWPEISKWIERSPVLKKFYEWQKTRVVMTQAAERWFATARTANKPENLAGFHEEHILFVVDEASGVRDEIFEVIEGALTTSGAKLLLCGNPTRTSGVFYDAFHSDRDRYWTFKVSCLNSPRVTDEYANNLKRKYGENSDVYRVRVLGEFPKAEPDVLIPLEMAEASTMRDVLEYDSKGEPFYLGHIHIGVDVSRYGSDETVLYYRVGPHVFEPLVFQKLSVPEVAGQVVKLAKELLERFHRPNVYIKIDIGAMGAGVFDLVVDESARQQGEWIVTPVNFGGAGDDENDDLATAMWTHTRDMLQAEEIHLPNDEKTVAQISTRKYKVTAKGKFKIESKDDYKKRHHESPDRADGLVLCLYEPRASVGNSVGVATAKTATAGIRRKTF